MVYAGLTRPIEQVLNNLGMLYTDTGDWRAAEDCLADALARAASASDITAQLRAQSNRAELYISQRRFRKARRESRRLMSLVVSFIRLAP